MHRRAFLKSAAAGLAAFAPFSDTQTRHVVFIVNGAARKRDYYENGFLAPNIRRLASEGFVFEQDHTERVASHDAAFAELLCGQPYGKGRNRFIDLHETHTLAETKRALETSEARLIVWRHLAPDVGHQSVDAYLRTVQDGDAAIGRLWDWVLRHPRFGGNTAIIVRPEFGRDDEVNANGELHHSYGFYCTHRVATIFWGPDFNRGIDSHTVISSLDMAPTLARLVHVNAGDVAGRVAPGLFRTGLRSSATILLG
jgi:arylsulfatase A-like enzyme